MTSQEPHPPARAPALPAGCPDGALTAQVERVRTILALGRSDALLRLFDYLVERSATDRAPKELEIAYDVFAREESSDLTQDATVRVYVHRLRKKLEDIYRLDDGWRLVIPKGEYRIDLAPPLDRANEPLPSLPNAPASVERPASAILVISVLVNGILLLFLLFHFTRPQPLPAIATTDFWRQLASAGRNEVLVLGDFYFFAETDGKGTVTRIMRDPVVNSREDLDVHFFRQPADLKRLYDFDLHFIPTSTAMASRALSAITDAISMLKHATPTRISSSSQLSAESLSRDNIVYVGQISGLGPMRNPLFQASGFRIGRSYDELIDKASGRRFLSDGGSLDDMSVPRQDFGLLASLPGPSGNRILIIAGNRAPAVNQMSEVATNEGELKKLQKRTGGAMAYEALYRVRTLGSANVGSELILVRPLSTNGIWDQARASQNFPHERSINAPSSPARP